MYLLLRRIYFKYLSISFLNLLNYQSVKIVIPLYTLLKMVHFTLKNILNINKSLSNSNGSLSTILFLFGLNHYISQRILY